MVLYVSLRPYLINPDQCVWQMLIIFMSDYTWYVLLTTDIISDTCITVKCEVLKGKKFLFLFLYLLIFNFQFQGPKLGGKLDFLSQTNYR